MPDSAGVPLIVLSRHDDNLSTVNTVLREAGHPVHCIRAAALNRLEEILRECRPEMLIYFADEALFELSMLKSVIDRLSPAPPLLLVHSRIDEQIIADAMNSGARDVVSLTHRNRFQAVVDRELKAHRLEVALDGVLNSATQYKQEMRILMDGTAEAIADVQEGIIVAVNAAWLNLFGYTDESQIVGTPFMDQHRTADHSIIKGALVACLKDRWDESTLQVTGLRADGDEVRLEVQLEKITIDGEPGVRVSVPGHAKASASDLLEAAVYKDPTTSFYHRHFFLERLEERLAEPLSGGVRAIAYLRPDRFAEVHDDIGLLATETLLTRLAELFKEFMQPRDLYGRFGGTMFVVLVERGTMGDVESWAEQVREAVEQHVFEVDDQSTSLTCTIGLNEVEADHGSLAELLRDVEQSCRRGRDAGGNRVEMSDRSQETQTIRAADALWLPRIQNALKKNRLRLAHQPIAGLTEEIDGVFDTRVRMLDEDDNIVLPREFLPAAQRAGLMKHIDRWVIGASFSFCAARRPTLVFVRLSADSVLDKGLLDWLLARLQSTRISAGQICFQVEEDVASQYLKQTKDLSQRLHEGGFLFAIDHLGTGRDSTQLLNHIPMDYAKIDGSLMQGLPRDNERQETVGALASTARERGIGTIAERVEDANTMAVLWQLGVAFIQGNHVQMHGVVLEDTQTVQSLGSSCPGSAGQ